MSSNPLLKKEYPPLLQPGRRGMSVQELEDLCVSPFPNSTTRPQIMEGLKQVILRLEQSGVVGHLWVDGSFLTQKEHPEDSDVVFFFSTEQLDRGTQNQISALEWLRAGQKGDHLCDSYIAAMFPEGHPNAVMNEYNFSYWHRQFGFSRKVEVKGIAVISVGAQP